MGSGNSGSVQSSSGGGGREWGEEEMNSSMGETSRFFDQSRRFTSQRNPTLFASSVRTQSLLLNPEHAFQQTHDLVWQNSAPSSLRSSSSFAAVESGPQSSITKKPRKRTRASRRAPTTVLTTDPSNFRQMVQQFTGFPTASFSASQYPRRLDLFAAFQAGGHVDMLGPLHPLRTNDSLLLHFPPPADSVRPTTAITHPDAFASNISENQLQNQRLAGIQLPAMSFLNSGGHPAPNQNSFSGVQPQFFNSDD